MSEEKETAGARRGRKPNQPAAVAQQTLDQERITNAMDVMRDTAHADTDQRLQHASRVRAIATQVGYQLPSDCTDPDLIQRDIAVNMRRTAEAMLQVGLGLLVLKEACQHGEFAARLEVLRFEPRVAQKYMQVARKISNAPSTAHLLKTVESQTKLLELIVLDDDQLEELALTGETGELKLDDVASMSVKELRAAVRDLRGEVGAKEKLLAHKSEELDRAALLKAAPPDDRLAAIREEVVRNMNDVRGALIGKFSAGIEAIDQHYVEFGGDQDVAFLAGMLGQLQADLQALRDRFGIPDIAPALIPDWVADPSFGKTGG
ncbi:hypothetical protein [Azonexus sp. R2A61]|uniref:hypothetical protein n=1 Tax=Azonexus sp. R2A61 TaxID=2744443 RepID=UPI001F3CB9E4|nr:hypothetical protein [Azonexus sp. R2A61]